MSLSFFFFFFFLEIIVWLFKLIHRSCCQLLCVRITFLSHHKRLVFKQTCVLLWSVGSCNRNKMLPTWEVHNIRFNIRWGKTTIISKCSDFASISRKTLHCSSTIQVFTLTSILLGMFRSANTNFTTKASAKIRPSYIDAVQVSCVLEFQPLLKVTATFHSYLALRKRFG